MKLTLLGRPGCHLCEEMVEALVTGFPALQGQVEEADVDSREDWQRRYGLKIPVLLDRDGTAVCVTQFDAAAVSEWLKEQQRAA